MAAHCFRCPLRRQRRARPNVCLLGNALSLLDDMPERARSEIETGLAQWPSNEFYVQHANSDAMLAMIELYEGCAEAAAERLDVVSSRLRSSHLWSVQVHRVRYHYLRGCAALRMGQQPCAARCVQRLERERTAHALACASILRAGANGADGAESRSLWRTSAVALSGCDMELHAACARARAGDASGAAWLEAQRIRNLPAIIDLFAPTSITKPLA